MQNLCKMNGAEVVYKLTRRPAGQSMAEPIVKGSTGAQFSVCRQWRYLLWRQWDAGKPAANFLMLNPSTADEFKLDPTCARARDYAQRWGFGTLIVTNVFGWRATDPAALRQIDDPIGPGNDHAIAHAAEQAALVVAAWGNHGAYLDRSRQVLRLLARLRIVPHVLRVNAGGEPAHPLYLPKALRPVPLDAAQTA